MTASGDDLPEHRAKAGKPRSLERPIDLGQDVTIGAATPLRRPACISSSFAPRPMPASHTAKPASRRPANWAVAGCLLLVIAVIYGQTLRFGFVTYDDGLFVTACPEVQAGLTSSSILWAFTNGPPASGIRWPCSRTCSIASCSTARRRTPS